MFRQRLYLLMLAAMAANIFLYASIPPGFYDRANGLKCKELKTAMHIICGQASVLGYGGGEGKTWTGFYTTDRLQDGSVRDRYSYKTFYYGMLDSELAAAAVSGMNIEHSFAKSWWGGTENQSYKDLFNLMPSESTINNSKSDNAMGIVTKPTSDNGCTKVGNGETTPGNTCKLWEPADQWKGDFARTYFYMVTMYDHLSWSGSVAPVILEDDAWPTLQPWAYNLYLDWARKDPVDDVERERNEAVFGIQGNRNPFVDFPNLHEYIWGDSTDYALEVEGAVEKVDPEAYSGLVAYPATELVSSIYSCRFDANWRKLASGTTYILDVYTKDTNGKKTSIGDYPLEMKSCTQRVTEAKANTTYYYTVSTADGASSQEVRVDMPKVAPVFNVNPSQVTFAVKPGEMSAPVEIKVELKATEENIVHVRTDAPFEISDTKDAMNWQHALTLSGSSSVFYVRLGTTEEEGTIMGNITLSVKGLKDKVIPMAASIDAQKAFFEDFEKGSKNGYTAATVTCSAATWYMDNSYPVKDTNANDTKSVRFKGGGYMEMQEDKTGGCDSLWFYAGLYNKDTGMSVSVSYSTDEGSSWTSVVKAMPVSTWQRYGFKLNVRDNLRLRFDAVGSTSKRINVDDIQMSDFQGEEDEDGIMDYVDERMEELPIYDLSGRRLRTITHKGIYIIGHRKEVRTASHSGKIGGEY